LSFSRSLCVISNHFSAIEKCSPQSNWDTNGTSSLVDYYWNQLGNRAGRGREGPVILIPLPLLHTHSLTLLCRCMVSVTNYAKPTLHWSPSFSMMSTKADGEGIVCGVDWILAWNLILAGSMAKISKLQDLTSPPPPSKTKQQNTNGFPFLLLSQSLWFVPAVHILYRYGIF
jgi:hypothetical protein